MPKQVLIWPLVVAVISLGCGAKRPVLYPNDTYEELGDEAAQEIVNYCLERADNAELADSQGEGAAKGAAADAVIGAAIWGAVGWIFGSPGRSAAAGGVVGGSGGAMRGAGSSGRNDMTYRRFVEICLTEQGLQPIGWK